LGPEDRVIRDLREESASEQPSIRASEHLNIRASEHLNFPAAECNAHAWPAFYALRVVMKAFLPSKHEPNVLAMFHFANQFPLAFFSAVCLPINGNR